MAQPIIIDDGGSMRIRQMRRNAMGVMDSLFDMQALPLGHGSSHDGISAPIGDPYTTVRIVWQDQDGNISNPLNRNFNQSVLISSDFGQKVLVERNGNGTKLKLTVYSPTTEPILESKQHKQKRRYIVMNAGPIQLVEVDGIVVYDTAQGTPDPSAGDAIYTNVVLT
jgi:hypothetical protein